MKDMLNVADKFLAMGQTIPQVVAEMTWNPAREIKQEQLGNLSVGSPADIAVLSVEQGRFGFVDMYDKKLMGTEKLVCQLTVRAGKIVFDLNGISADLWNVESDNDSRQARRWTTFSDRPRRNRNTESPATTVTQ
jgi:dihydroorotase